MRYQYNLWLLILPIARLLLIRTWSWKANRRKLKAAKGRTFFTNTVQNLFNNYKFQHKYPIDINLCWEEFI